MRLWVLFALARAREPSGIPSRRVNVRHLESTVDLEPPYSVSGSSTSTIVSRRQYSAAHTTLADVDVPFMYLQGREPGTRAQVVSDTSYTGRLRPRWAP